MTKDELLKLVTTLQAELEATNRQVEILSDALAESRREVAQLKARSAPVQEPVITEGWERRKVIGFDALVEALDYAERKGFMPDYIANAWEGFNYLVDEKNTPPAAQPAPAQEPEPEEWDERCVLGHCGSPTGCELSNRCRADNPPAAPVQWPIDSQQAARIAEQQCVSYEVVQIIAREILASPPAAPVQEPDKHLQLALEALAPLEKLLVQADEQGLLNGANVDCQIATIELRKSAYAASDIRAYLNTTPPAAQRTWVGLTDEELKDIELECHKTLFGKIEAMQKVEAKLKEKNA
jgi:hypothetical protein